MKKYYVSVRNTCTGKYEAVEVTREVYEEYRRAEWTEENDQRRFYKHQIPFSDLIGNEEDISENFHEFVDISISQFEEAFDPEPEVNAIEIMHQALATLKESERELINALFFLGKTETSVGKELGINQPAVSGRKKRILAKLRRNIQKKCDNS